MNGQSNARKSWMLKGKNLYGYSGKRVEVEMEMKRNSRLASLPAEKRCLPPTMEPPLSLEPEPFCGCGFLAGTKLSASRHWLPLGEHTITMQHSHSALPRATLELDSYPPSIHPSAHFFSQFHDTFI